MARFVYAGYNGAVLLLSMRLLQNLNISWVTVFGITTKRFQSNVTLGIVSSLILFFFYRLMTLPFPFLIRAGLPSQKA
jgi:hypothetical protein